MDSLLPNIKASKSHAYQRINPLALRYRARHPSNRGGFSFPHTFTYLSTSTFTTHVNYVYHRRYHGCIAVSLTFHCLYANMNSWVTNNRLKPIIIHQLLNVFHSDSSTTRPFKRSNAKFVFVRSKHYISFQSKTPPFNRRCFNFYVRFGV